MAPGLQLRPQLNVVENFPVENNPHGPVLIGNRLLARVQVDDTQARVTESNRALKIDAKLIRATMANRGQHLANGPFIHGLTTFEIQYASDAAHT